MRHLGPTPLGILAVLILACVFFLERAAPARASGPSGRLRRAQNLLLGGIGILATHLVPGGALVAVAAWGRAEGLGLFHAAPPAFALPLSVAGLDLALWSQHRVSHVWAWFWRLHAVHHGDDAMDVTTAFRFHPVERVLSMGWKAAAVLLLAGGRGAEVMVGALDLPEPCGVEEGLQRGGPHGQPLPSTAPWR